MAKIMDAPRVLTRALLALALVASLVMPPASVHAAANDPFTFLAPGFTQELYATDLPWVGGVAFAPSGDAVEAFQKLYRIESTQTITIHGSTVHPTTQLSGTLWIGLANSQDNGIYANTSAGVIRVDSTTGSTIAGPFGPNGNGFGIVSDPKTQNLVYVGDDCQMHFVSRDLTHEGLFSSVSACGDGIAFDPKGDFLFVSVGADLDVLDRNNNLVQSVPLDGGTCCTDGVAFHGGSPQFVISNNTNGTVTRFDFPGNDYSQTPTQSIFASGGFRGDHLGVGQDGCAYLTQANTRFADGTIGAEPFGSTGSLVRVCPGFVPSVPGFAFPSGGAFVISSQESGTGSQVTFWGAQWSKSNPTTSGGVASFKGFAASSQTPQCGIDWVAETGSSGPPPDGPLPDDMAVIVTDSYSMSGSTIIGNTVHIVVLDTDPGYGPDAGHPGTGRVIRQLC